MPGAHVKSLMALGIGTEGSCFREPTQNMNAYVDVDVSLAYFSFV